MEDVVDDCKCAYCEEDIDEDNREWKRVTAHGTIFLFCSYLCFLRFAGIDPDRRK